jgi:protoheme IX farnesyltransferase
MAAGRFSLWQGVTAGLGALALGAWWLLLHTNLLTVSLALLTAFTYVAVYTPLKRFTAMATFIGAFPGAMGPMLGWTAARGRMEWPAVALFAILFVWQFPHFMAISWLYRDDYARAGIRLTATLGDARYAARATVIQALFYATLMVGVSLWPFVLGTAGYVYAGAASLLSLGYLWYTIRFAGILRSAPAKSENPAAGDALLPPKPARDLLHASIIYLPLLLAAMMLDARGRLLF